MPQRVQWVLELKTLAGPLILLFVSMASGALGALGVVSTYQVKRRLDGICQALAYLIIGATSGGLLTGLALFFDFIAITEWGHVISFAGLTGAGVVLSIGCLNFISSIAFRFKGFEVKVELWQRDRTGNHIRWSNKRHDDTE